VSHHDSTLVNELLGVLPVPGLAEDRIAGGEQARRHVPTHVPEADEAERCVALCLGHLVPLTRRLRARRIAAIPSSSSNCPH
jgi:hypothetical protein